MFVYCEAHCGIGWKNPPSAFYDNWRNKNNSEFVRKRLAARDGQPVPYIIGGKPFVPPQLLPQLYTKSA